MGLFRSPRSRPGGSGAQEGRFRSPNRPNLQSREQMGLFRSPRSRQDGSGAQEGRFRSPNRPNQQSREQMGLFRSPRSRPGGSGAQKGRLRSPNRPNHQSREQMGLFRSPRSRQGGSGAQEGRFRSRRVIDAVMVGRQSAAGCWQRAVGSRQRGTGSGQSGNGQRAVGERAGRRNRLRKGSATKALIIQHLNVDNCLQIRIILTTIAKIADGKTEGKSWLTSIISDFPQHDTN